MRLAAGSPNPQIAVLKQSRFKHDGVGHFGFPNDTHIGYGNGFQENAAEKSAAAARLLERVKKQIARPPGQFPRGGERDDALPNGFLRQQTGLGQLWCESRQLPVGHPNILPGQGDGTNGSMMLGLIADGTDRNLP